VIRNWLNLEVLQWKMLLCKLYVYFVYFTAIRYTYFMVIWNILWLFGLVFPVLVSCTKKNLATLKATTKP
jgi:hypothetical protein